jgi:hypothetical protein
MSDSETRLARLEDPSLVLAEVEAAERLLADDAVPLSVGAVHLRRAWSYAFRSREGDGGLDRATWAGEQVDARVDARERASAKRVLEAVLTPAGEPNTSLVSRRELCQHAAVLRNLQQPPRPSRDAWFGLGVSFVAAVIFAMIGAALLSVIRGPTGPWRGQFFDNEDFEGDAKLQHARKIEFDFGKGSPIRGIGKDHWSAIWETCLILEEDATARFKVSSDDGAKVFVNGDLVVDNWGAHATRTRTGRAKLEAGVHHIRIDYFEASHGANVEVLASFDDEDVASIPVTMLDQPGDDADAPCE